MLDSITMTSMMEIILSDVKVCDGEQIARHIEVPTMRDGPLHQPVFPFIYQCFRFPDAILL